MFVWLDGFIWLSGIDWLEGCTLVRVSGVDWLVGFGSLSSFDSYIKSAVYLDLWVVSGCLVSWFWQVIWG